LPALRAEVARAISWLARCFEPAGYEVGWSQVAVQKAGTEQGRGRVIGIDLLAIEPLPGADFKALDFMPATRRCCSRIGSTAGPTWSSPTWRRMRPGDG
jgi:hypothetical protein